MTHEEWLKAVNLALNGDWHGAHNIAQQCDDTNANWLHAALHKIEGDVWNSKYWYAKTAGHYFDEYAHSQDEFHAMLKIS